MPNKEEADKAVSGLNGKDLRWPDPEGLRGGPAPTPLLWRARLTTGSFKSRQIRRAGRKKRHPSPFSPVALSVSVIVIGKYSVVGFLSGSGTWMR